RGRDRCGATAPTRRYGLPAPELLRQIDLRQCRLWFEDPWLARPRADRRASRAGSAAGGAVGRGQGSPDAFGLWPVGRAAAAAVYRACDRPAAGCAADGRAVL